MKNFGNTKEDIAHTGEKFSVCEQEQENPKHQFGAASSWYSGHNRALKSLGELSYFPQAKVLSWISNINAACIFLFFFSPCNYSVCLRKKKKVRKKEKKQATCHLGVTEKPAGVKSIEEIAQNHFTFVGTFSWQKAGLTIPEMVT